MSLYGGIDLHSSNNLLVVLNQDLETLFERRLPNELGQVLARLEPYREDLVGIAIESMRNWYWLVDGLMEAGYRAHLTNTSAVRQYEGLKYTDDRHDARWLARLLCLGILPEGYIYPKEQRPWRDLLRRRAFLVHKRRPPRHSLRAPRPAILRSQVRQDSPHRGDSRPGQQARQGLLLRDARPSGLRTETSLWMIGRPGPNP